MNGPNYLPYLLDVLLRFRCHSYALTADIEKAFLQVEIRESDRDKLRFLWFSDIESDKPSVIQFRFCRLPFGLRPSPSILGATIRKHLEGYVARFPKTVEVLGRLFVDDLSCSTKTSDSALDIARTSKTILAEGAFSLLKIVSSKKLDVKPQVSVGDIVVLYDEQSKRNFWKICKVEDLIIGNDKNVRAAKVKVPNRKGTSILTRSLKHLIPLEVQLSECSSENKTDSTRLETVPDKDQAEISVSSRKAKRNAAIIGEIRRRDDCY